ncbi:MAG: Gx transporter family protein [Acetivibrionales bacterium]|jgi:heptaprenyl diphosphate synthase
MIYGTGDRVQAGSETKCKENKMRTKRLVLTGLIFALAIILSAVENAFPPLPLPVPGVKFGLSNIAVMYALFFLSARQAYSIAVLKSVFVTATRGMTAGILSLSGGILSLTVMLILFRAFGKKPSIATISISGAVAHNIGQFAAIAIIYSGMNLWAYLPLLLVSGAAAGIVTASLLRVVIPVLDRLNLF